MFDVEPGGLDGGACVAGGVAAAGDSGPESGVVDELKQGTLRLAVGDHVLVETELAARANYAEKLG